MVTAFKVHQHLKAARLIVQNVSELRVMNGCFLAVYNEGVNFRSVANSGHSRMCSKAEGRAISI